MHRMANPPQSDTEETVCRACGHSAEDHDDFDADPDDEVRGPFCRTCFMPCADHR